MCIAQNKLECSQLFDHNVQDSPGCTKGVERCTLDPWIIEKKETMVVYNDTSNTGYPLMMNNGIFERRTGCNEKQAYNILGNLLFY